MRAETDISARSNNVGIMLARLRLSPLRIKTAILECDEETLSVDDLAMLVRMLPSPEEAERLRTFDGGITKLAKPDSFLREISTIPRIKDRIEAMVFKQRFELHIAELVPDLAILRSAMMEVRESERFREVLALVLRLGNRLNGGTFRGNAMGFRMGDLLKMKETRTSQPKCPTLLHYLASTLLKVNAQLILFSEEMSSLEAAARCELTPSSATPL
ncbi:uncharacterized protein MKK02DRAFT_20897 [Dioszegia hungarica]|uniref:FH2 domain-containing protein n=1 Tax=Dioszegia hungarica TaxID=4972 RepID=A0AA38H189_9TREE|nr:uncharacterized protein MKK02DRAFT_20897 [Dioszegia hungarica]KAI9632080.1 hypothetical protein MKK02DRAFT_20897 [Dioszegia hungarica]